MPILEEHERIDRQREKIPCSSQIQTHDLHICMRMFNQRATNAVHHSKKQVFMFLLDIIIYCLQAMSQTQAMDLKNILISSIELLASLMRMSESSIVSSWQGQRHKKSITSRSLAETGLPKIWTTPLKVFSPELFSMSGKKCKNTFMINR